ncbi:hypothetical protein C2S52_016943 [Perilla frutescens var. hirtella]|nr:hypothetical protein C2S52_016943 [Perilla frutescens var. hirtella]KAH6810763.1 hypothetical protein C2S51_024525 [Perilla frutescens var. frutescens]
MMKALSSNPIVARWIVMVVVCTIGVTMQAVEGQSRLGQCLIGCFGSAMSCVVDCGISRGGTGTIACYQGCGAENFSCLVSCYGKQLIPKSMCD